MLEVLINTPFSTVVLSPTGPSDNPGLEIYLNGNKVSGIASSVTSINSTNRWKLTFTPNSTGVWSVYVFGSLQLTAVCVPKTSIQILRNLEDEALGSWSWDKVSGTLTLLRQDGTPLANHIALDTLTNASRERQPD